MVEKQTEGIEAFPTIDYIGPGVVKKAHRSERTVACDELLRWVTHNVSEMVPTFPWPYQNVPSQHAIRACTPTWPAPHRLRGRSLFGIVEKRTQQARVLTLAAVAEQNSVKSI